MTWRRLVDAWLVVAVAVFVALAVYALRFPFAIDYGEGPLCDQARRLLAGQWLYRADWSQPPFTVDNYPPLYPLVVAALARAAHLSLLGAGRAISIAATAGAALLLARLARRAHGEPVAGRLAAALFLSHPYVLEWAIAARVDALALALSLAALALVEARPRSTAAAVAAAACAVLAAFTRQSYALAVPAACAYWLWQQRRSCALVFVATALTAAALAFAWLDRATGHGFYLHVVRANWNEYRFARVVVAAAQLAGLSLPTVALLLSLRRAPAAPTPWQRATYVYVATAAVAALTAGKVGAATNYMIELVAALALVAAATGPELARSGRRMLPLFALAPAAWIGATTYMLWRDKLEVGHRSRAAYVALAELIRATDGPLLADDAMAMIVQAGKPLAFQPFERRQLERQGLWDAAPVVGGLRAQRYPLVILGAPGTPLCVERWGQPILDAVAQFYRPVLGAGALVAYRPLP